MQGEGDVGKIPGTTGLLCRAPDRLLIFRYRTWIGQREGGKAWYPDQGIGPEIGDLGPKLVTWEQKWQTGYNDLCGTGEHHGAD